MRITAGRRPLALLATAVEPSDGDPAVGDALEHTLVTHDHDPWGNVRRRREARIDRHRRATVEREPGTERILGVADLEGALGVDPLGDHDPAVAMHVDHLPEHPPQRVDDVGTPRAHPTTAPGAIEQPAIRPQRHRGPRAEVRPADVLGPAHRSVAARARAGAAASDRDGTRSSRGGRTPPPPPRQ